MSNDPTRRRTPPDEDKGEWADIWEAVAAYSRWKLVINPVVSFAENWRHFRNALILGALLWYALRQEKVSAFLDYLTGVGK